MSLEWTGERLTEGGFQENITTHLHRYAIAMEVIKGKNVLDIASGEGYGSHLMSSLAQSVLGIDIAEEAVEFAQKKYQKPNLSYKQGSATDIPTKDNQFDVVVSYETLEHLADHEKMLSELKRVLKPNGILFISTPDKKNYTDKTGFNNKFHVKELYLKEFQELIQAHFEQAQFFLQRFAFGSRLVQLGSKVNPIREYKGDFKKIESNNPLDNSLYVVAVASNAELPMLPNSFMDAGNLVKAKEEEIYNSKVYRVGRLVTSPLRLLRKLTGRRN